MQRRVPSTWFIIFLENFFENIILALFCFADSKRHQSAAIHPLQAIAFASLCHFISSTSFLLQSGMSDFVMLKYLSHIWRRCFSEATWTRWTDDIRTFSSSS